MSRPGLRHPVLLLTVAASVLVLDQLTKHWALDELADGHIVDVIWTIRFRLAFNTGAAFSSGTGFGKFIGLAAIAIVLVLIWTSRSVGSRMGTVAVGLVLGGAVGNLLDRVFRSPGFGRGAVIDFVDLRWWPVFNVADAAITIGCVVLVLVSFNRGEQ